MIALLIVVSVCLLLYLWRPAPEAFSSWIRNYLLRVLGVVTAAFALRKLLLTLGLVAWAHPSVSFCVTIGLALLLAGLVPDPFYLLAFSLYWPWNLVPKRFHRLLLVALGFLFGGLGAQNALAFSRALTVCEQRYAQAKRGLDSALVDESMPDSSVRSFGKGRQPPLSCRRLRAAL